MDDCRQQRRRKVTLLFFKHSRDIEQVNSKSNTQDAYTRWYLPSIEICSCSGELIRLRRGFCFYEVFSTATKASKTTIVFAISQLKIDAPCTLSWSMRLKSKVESCGARFLAPRTGIAPLSFAPTRTGPKNSKFYGPDPGPTRLYFPRTGPDRNSLASTRNLKVSTRTDPKYLKYGKYFVLRSKRSNQVSDYNKHVNMPFNKVMTSNNVLIKDNNHSSSSVWEWKASLSPKPQEKMSHTR